MSVKKAFFLGIICFFIKASEDTREKVERPSLDVEKQAKSYSTQLQKKLKKSSSATDFSCKDNWLMSIPYTKTNRAQSFSK